MNGVSTFVEQAFDKNLVAFVEQEYYLSGAIPDHDRIARGLGRTKQKVVDAMMRTENLDALRKRGIEYYSDDYALTPEQLAVANTLLDMTDGRSQKKKLTDLNVSSRVYQAWLRTPAFQNYMRQRAESALNDNMHEAHLALLDSVRRGDTPALKLYYDVTGRHSEKNTNAVDVATILVRIIEILSRHITDPALLNVIAGELEQISPQQQYTPQLSAPDALAL